MMETFIIVVVTLVILSLFAKKQSFSNVPTELVRPTVKGTDKICVDLENSLSSVYMDNIKTRLSKEKRLKTFEFEWRWYELKRFFILCGILKEAPMFSEKVDDVWHEMLMFTKDYEEFSSKYMGKTLHHSPNIVESPNPGLRGFFDWVYSTLFDIHKESAYLYEGFFKHPVYPDVIRHFQTWTVDELKQTYFSCNDTYTEMIEDVIMTMKRQANEIETLDRKEVKKRRSMARKTETLHLLSVPMLYYSLYHYNNYTNYMAVSSSSSSSSCTSCSSCSSCSGGSSCSSCGGGGD